MERWKNLLAPFVLLKFLKVKKGWYYLVVIFFTQIVLILGWMSITLAQLADMNFPQKRKEIEGLEEIENQEEEIGGLKEYN